MIEELIEKYGIDCHVSGRDLALDDLIIHDKTPRKVERLAIEAGFDKRQPLELIPGQFWAYYTYLSIMDTVTRFGPETNEKVGEPVTIALYIQKGPDPTHPQTEDIVTRVFLRVLDGPYTDPNIIAESAIYLKRRKIIRRELPKKFYNSKSETRQNAEKLGIIITPVTAAYVSILTQLNPEGPLPLIIGAGLICMSVWYARRTVQKDSMVPVKKYEDLRTKLNIYPGQQAVKLMEAMSYTNTLVIPEPPQIYIPPEPTKPNINPVRQQRYKKSYRRTACGGTTEFMRPPKHRAGTTELFLIE